MTRDTRRVGAIRRKATRLRERGVGPELLEEGLDRTIACRDRLRRELWAARSDTTDINAFATACRAFRRATCDLLALAWAIADPAGPDPLRFGSDSELGPSAAERLFGELDHLSRQYQQMDLFGGDSLRHLLDDLGHFLDQLCGALNRSDKPAPVTRETRSV
jgi:hypothetical protein